MLHHSEEPNDRDALACDMSALTPEQRKRHHVLAARLLEAAPVRREIDRGWEVRVDRSVLPLEELGEWISLEARCCPFLDFEISIAAGAEPVRVRLTAAVDAREFLRAELNL
ncbi:MAG: hypothetical protein ACRD2J_06790 [Thermoanaerobaculia bacterium]